MEERNTQQDQVNMMQDQMPADESGLGGDFEEKKKTGKKKWLLAGGVIGLLAVVGIVALAGTMLFQSNQAKFVRALAEAFTSRPETTIAEDVFGYEEMSQLYMEEPYAYGASLVLEDSNLAELAPLSGGSISMEFSGDYQAVETGGRLMIGYQDMELLGISFGMDRERMILSFPGLTDRALTIDYGEGFEDKIASSYLVQGNGMTVGEIEELTDSLQVLREAMDSIGEMEPINWTDLADRFWTAVDLASTLEEAIEAERSGQQTFTINGTQTVCTGYQVTLRHDGLMEILEKCKSAVLEDEQMSQLAYSYVSQLELAYGDGALAEAGAGGLEGALDDLLDIVDANTGDIYMTGYLDRSGTLASLTVETDFTVDGETFRFSEEILFQGGSYLAENMEITATVTGSSGTSVEAELSRTGNTQDDLAGRDWDMIIYIDGVKVLTGRLGMTYNRVTNEASLTGLLRDESTYSSVDLEIEGVFDQIDKGKGYHFSADQGTLRISGIALDFTGELYMNPTDQVTMPSGETFDIWTEDEAGWTDLEMELYQGFYLLGSQLGLITY